MGKRNIYQGTALLLAGTMLLLTACSSEEETERSVYVGKVNAVLSEDSKWYAASLEGAIDESLVVAPEDDFYTYVNKDAILAIDLDQMEAEYEARSYMGFGTDSVALVDTRLEEILTDSAEGIPKEERTKAMTEAEAQHLQEQVNAYAALVNDKEKRNREGLEPIRDYVQQIRSVSTLSELSDYLADPDRNFGGEYLLYFTVDRVPQSEREKNTVQISGNYPNLTLGSAEVYEKLETDSKEMLRYEKLRWRSMLEKLGCTEAESSRLITLGLDFESQLAKVARTYTVTGTSTKDYMEQLDQTAYQMEDLEEMCGDYPIRAVLTSLGLGTAEDYAVQMPRLIRKTCALYKESRLEELKAFLTLQLLNHYSYYLDEETLHLAGQYEEDAESGAEAAEEESIENTGASEDENTAEQEALAEAMAYVQQDLPEVLEELYAVYYCEEDEKEALKALIYEEIEVYEDLIRSEEWLSEETKDRAVEKLRGIEVRVMYPDVFTDYSGLVLTEAENLAEARHQIERYEQQLRSSLVDTPYDRGTWRMQGQEITTNCNAYYNPLNNTVTILAGILADGTMYSDEHSLEENLGAIGLVAGHEIGHAFDDSGSEYDRYGNYQDWWTREDREAYGLRVQRLQNYYDSLQYYPGGSYVSGSRVSGEVAADMTGLSCVMLLAKQQEGFDYESFFRATAESWLEKQGFGEYDYYYEDEHPVGMIRVNGMLSQNAEFRAFYDLKEGDGMYVSDEDNIAVW